MFKKREKTPKVTCPSCGKPNIVPDDSGPGRCSLCNGILPWAAAPTAPVIPTFEVVAPPQRTADDETFDFGALVVGAPGQPRPSTNDI